MSTELAASKFDAEQLWKNETLYPETLTPISATTYLHIPDNISPIYMLNKSDIVIQATNWIKVSFRHDQIKLNV
jgi:hypothetical protein